VVKLGNNGMQIGSFRVFAIFFVFCFLAYSSAVYFQYYLSDDLWLFRPQEEGFPNIFFISFVQGRPIFALFIQLSRELHDVFGPIAVSIIRFQGIFFLALFGVGVAFWVKVWVRSEWAALVVAIVLVTLPTSQMYVVGGPWFAWAWAFAAWAPYLLRSQFAYRHKMSGRLRILFILAGLCLCFGTYQATPFVFISLLIVPLVFDSEAAQKNIKLLVFLVLVFGAALAAYWATWLLMNVILNVSGDGRYSPRSHLSSLSHLFNQATMVFEALRYNRLPVLSAWWDVRSSAPDRTWFMVSVIIAGAIVSILRTLNLREILVRAAFWGGAILLFVFSDLPALSNSQALNVLSYMTGGPIGISFALLFLGALVGLVRGLQSLPAVRDFKNRRLVPVALSAGVVAIVAMGMMASYTSTAYYVLPAWFEQAAARSQIREALTKVDQITTIKAYTNTMRSLSSNGRGEFGWSNFGGSFYLHWLLRRILDDLDQNSSIRIDVVDGRGNVLTWPKYDVVPTDEGRVTVDLRTFFLDRDSSSRPSQPDGPRPSHTVGVVEQWNTPPAGTERIPLEVTNSSFSFDRQGAIGQGGLVDNDVSTPAADPEGVNYGTFVELHLSQPGLISHLRLLRDSVWASRFSLVLKVEAKGLDGQFKEVGEITVDPGTSSISETELNMSEPVTDLRISYQSGRVGQNLWLSEIAAY
jgi:hypothetical protein